MLQRTPWHSLQVSVVKGLKTLTRHDGKLLACDKMVVGHCNLRRLLSAPASQVSTSKCGLCQL